MQAGNGVSHEEIHPTPPRVFLCYSHEDRDLCKELEKHLSASVKSGKITIWHDKDIIPGQDWQSTITTNLESANLILPLISPEFLASQHCWEELEKALELHDTGTVQIVPIILKPVNWRSVTKLQKLQVLPSQARPVTQWNDNNLAFQDVVKGVERVIDKSKNENLIARMLGIISTVPTRVKKIAALPWISSAFILLFLAGIVSYFSISDLSVLSLIILSFFALSPVLLLFRIERLNRQTTGKRTERRILLGALYLGFLSLAGIARFNEEKLKNVLKSGQLTQFRMALLPGRPRVPLLEDRLSNELDHIPVHLVETETFEDTIQALAKGDVEAAWLGPISYLRAQSDYGGRALLRNLTLSGQKTYQSYFIAHTSANIRTLEDFKGLTLAFVDPDSTSGDLLPRYFLKKAGLDLGKSDIKIKYLGSHEEVLKRVKDKTYLVGAIESNIYEDALKRGEAKELVHIETKEKIDIPKGPLTIRKDILHYDELRIADALLSIAETAPSIINTIGDGGYVKVKHEDYVFLLDIVKAAGGDITKYD